MATQLKITKPIGAMTMVELRTALIRGTAVLEAGTLNHEPDLVRHLQSRMHLIQARLEQLA